MSSHKDDDKKQSRNRRTTLKTLLAGGVVTLGALPTRWFKPVVDSVSLPAHAKTSGGGSSPARNGFNVPALTRKAPDWLESIFPKAYAGFRFVASGFLCIESTGSEMIKASFEFDGSGDIVTGSGTVGSCVDLICIGSNESVSLIVTSVNGDGSFDFELYPPGVGCDAEPFFTGTTDTPCDVQAAQCSSM